MTQNVDLVLITYFPDKKLLIECLNSIRFQVRHIIIVSNYDDDFSFLGINCIHINLKENLGIAYAQNIGIKKSLSLGAEFILTSDQDTIYSSDYVENMLNVYDSGLYNKDKIAAICPMFKDASNQNTLHPIVKYGKFGLHKIINPTEIHSVSHVISSGMIIPAQSIQNVGLMKESFFIDWVDTEWCWRAVNLGYKIIQVNNVTLNHSLGNKSRKFLKYNFTEHNATREYYKIRNAVLLLQDQNYKKIGFRIYLTKTICKYVMSNLLRSAKSIKYIKAVSYGLFHGVFKQEGKFSK